MKFKWIFSANKARSAQQMRLIHRKVVNGNAKVRFWWLHADQITKKAFVEIDQWRCGDGEKRYL